ncbi:P-loop containing nucleoside triphosphate hydrolase protein [Chytriomyces cf. hyalinus JEL632]|nr:P-loop containing nucleoside triphosphate hydrolase protein [Chytriomyces cf. hyalinus JEL632]
MYRLSGKGVTPQDAGKGCMNYRLQQSFSQRLLALSIISDTMEAKSIPGYQSKAENDLLLSRDEQLCLSKLRFQSPTTVDAIRPMLKYIAARFDPDDLIEFHSHICRSLHSSPVTLNTLYMLMWGSCQGSLLIQMEGIADLGPLSVYEYVKEPELNLREQSTPSKMCHVTPDECGIEMTNIGLSNTAVKHEDAEFNLTESSALVNVRKQARDLLISNEQEYAESILKAAPFACALVAKTAVVLYEAKVLVVFFSFLHVGINIYRVTYFLSFHVQNNLRIVWQIDVAYLEAPRCYSQVIKVECFGNHAHVIAADKYVTGAQRAYSQDRINRCKIRKEENGIVYPVIFNEDCQDGTVDFTLSVSDDEDNDQVKIHEASVTSKFIPFSKMFMRLLLAGPNASIDCEFPFAVSEQEAEILNHNRSVIVIGRSGTGKTSCSLFRLLANLHSRRVAFKMNREYPSHQTSYIPRPLQAHKETTIPRKFAFRQIFMTASPKFCRRVKAYYFKRLMHSVDPGDITLSPPFSSTDAVPTDTTVDDLALDHDASDAIDDGQDVYSPEADFNLPDSFGDLQDADCPLFVHYKKLISMIRVFLGSKEDVALVEEGEAERNVDYERFNEIYALLDKKLTNGLDVSLTFSEIMGVIEGHQIAARTLSGALSREIYCGMSTRQSGHALQKSGDRDRMYSVFEVYNAKKLERHQLANEISRILHKMAEQNDPNLSAILVNQVYLDKVQDLTMAPILPLITICSDPEHALMFAGDTAQVIHRGSSCQKKAITEAPKQFTLTKNYRSHDGILAVAASVLDILIDLFPNAIDGLKREEGAIAGPQPVLVTDSSGENGIVDFLRGGKSEGAPIEFGAGQVILVRSLKEAVELKTGLTKGYALILTVEQVKGMEFRDVVLYNLITSSSASDQQWRVLLSQLSVGLEGVPKFNAGKHNILSAELKILCTAVTRARSRLWVFEEDSKKSDPLFKIWHTKNLVVTSDDARSGKFSSLDSTFEEWKAQGRRLFEEQMYGDALRCFQRGLAVANRGNESADTRQCEAKMKLVEARALSDAASAEARSLFYEAGELLRRANQMSWLPAIQLIEAAQCYEICEEHVKTSEVYEIIPNPTKEAARCFRRDYIQSPSCSEKALSLVARLKKAHQPPDLLTLEQVSTSALANPLLSRKEKVTAIELIPDPDIRKGLLRNQGIFSEVFKAALAMGDYHPAGRVMDIDMRNLQEAGRTYKRIGGMAGWLLASECLRRLFWIRVTPAIEAIFCGDPSKMQELDAVAEIGKNSLLNESIKEMKKLKAMYSKTDPTLQTVRWFEIEEAMDPFINRMLAHPTYRARIF